MKKILLIEDNVANRTLIARVLEPHNYTLLFADEGEAGIQMAIDEQPDLILVDMGLPDLDGQTVITLLQQIPTLQQTPFVIITAWPADKAQEMAERYGCQGCITKPIDVKNFPQQITQYLEDQA